MVSKSVFSLILLTVLVSGTCKFDIQNNMIKIAYQAVAIIMIGLALFTIYTYIMADQQKKITLRASVINYLFGVFILIAIPGFSELLCTLQNAIFGQAMGGGNYYEYSINTLQSRTDGVLSDILRAYDKLAYREGMANIPYSFSIVAIAITGSTILYVIMSLDQPNLLTTAIMKSMVFPVITYLPYKQYIVYNTVTNRIVRDLEIIYIGLQVHLFILEIIRNGLFAGIAIGGVVIRLIPGLKKAGDMLIALGIGMHILYPFIYSIYLKGFDTIFNIDQDLYNLDYVDKIFMNETNLSYYKISVFQLMVITLPNLSLAVVAAFAMNAYKTFDFIESL